MKTRTGHITGRQDAEGRAIPQTIPCGPGLVHINPIVADSDSRIARHFDPPSESPLETLFAAHASKVLDPAVNFIKQSPVQTRWGSFRLDFLLIRDGLRVNVETDGRDFHDICRDFWRDALVLGTGSVDAIIRLRGTDVYRFPSDCLYLMGFWYPKLFSERGHRNLHQLTTRSVRRTIAEQRDIRLIPEKFRVPGNRLDDDDFSAILYPCRQCDEQECSEDEHSPCPDSEIVVWRRVRTHRQYKPLWKPLYDFACTSTARSLDELIAEYDRNDRRAAEMRHLLVRNLMFHYAFHEPHPPLRR